MFIIQVNLIISFKFYCGVVTKLIYFRPDFDVCKQENSQIVLIFLEIFFHSFFLFPGTILKKLLISLDVYVSLKFIPGELSALPFSGNFWFESYTCFWWNRTNSSNSINWRRSFLNEVFSFEIILWVYTHTYANII